MGFSRGVVATLRDRDFDEEPNRDVERGSELEAVEGTVFNGPEVEELLVVVTSLGFDRARGF